MIVTYKHPYNWLYMYSNNFEAQTIIGGFMQYFNTTTKIDEAYSLLSQPDLEYRNLGCNDDSIKITNEFVEFDYYSDTKDFRLGNLYPYKLGHTEFKSFLDKAKIFLLKYEQLKIPGLIPKTEFAKWSIAPNEYIDSNYHDRKTKLNKDLLSEIGITSKTEKILQINSKYPQLFEDLKDHKSVTNGNPIKIKGLQLAILQTVDHDCYYGNIYGGMYSKIIDYKIEEYGFPKSIRSTIGYRVNHKEFETQKLDDLLETWKSKLENDQLKTNLIREIGLIGSKNEIEETFNRFPNLLIELEELLDNHKEELSRSLIKSILLEKIESEEDSENLSGHLRGQLIRHLLNQHKIDDKNWKYSEELSQWSFKNKWGLTEFEEYIKANINSKH